MCVLLGVWISALLTVFAGVFIGGDSRLWFEGSRCPGSVGQQVAPPGLSGLMKNLSPPQGELLLRVQLALFQTHQCVLPGEVRGGEAVACLCVLFWELHFPYARRAGMGSRKATDLKLLAVSDNIQKARLRVAERDVAP